MNTVADILILQSIAQSRNQGLGINLDPEGRIFQKRFEELIKWAYYASCLSEEDRKNQKYQFPSLREMCQGLSAINPRTPLSITAQAAFYCAFFTLLNPEELENLLFVKGQIESGFIPR